MKPSFNLIDEPWIEVRTQDDGVTETSLRDVFHKASYYRGLSGEIPTQRGAILRLLLAILLRATSRIRNDDEILDDWAEWWETGLPLDEIDAYLDRHHERFWLFSDSIPFMQVTGLHTKTGSTSGLYKIILEVPPGHKFFTTRDGRGITSLEYSEAARWLVHAQSYDTSGIKSGAVGDTRVKDGKGYPIGCGLTGNMGLVILEGASLAQTLLLNTVMTNDPTGDVPVWERQSQGPAEDSSHPVPMGPADLFTWQSRRIRLIDDGSRVVDALVCNGDKVGWQYLFNKDPLTGWRYSERQSKAAERVVYMPRKHDSSRALWRGLAPLLTEAPKPEPGAKATKDGVATWVRPGVLEQLATFRVDGAVPSEHPVRLRVIGMDYEMPKMTKITSTIDDSMSAVVASLTDPGLTALAVDEAAVAEAVATCVARLAGNLATAAGNDPGVPRTSGKEAAYSVLGPAYEEWFRDSLPSAATRKDASVAWHRTARAAARRLGEQLCRDAGSSALTGRIVPTSSKGGTALMDTAQAWRSFLGRLRDAAPLPEDPMPPSRPTTRKEK